MSTDTVTVSIQEAIGMLTAQVHGDAATVATMVAGSADVTLLACALSRLLAVAVTASAEAHGIPIDVALGQLGLAAAASEGAS